MNFLTKVSFPVLFILSILLNHSVTAQKDDLKKKLKLFQKTQKALLGLAL